MGNLVLSSLIVAHRLRWSREAYEDALEKARPSEGEILREDHYLEEIHIAAISNVLRRPIMVLSEVRPSLSSFSLSCSMWQTATQRLLLIPTLVVLLVPDLTACLSFDRSCHTQGMQGGMFLPTRHDPEACRLPDGRAAPPVVMYQDLEHYIPLVVQRPQDYWDWATTLLHGDTAALDALRWVHVTV
jgi:hypothetical protein